MVEEARLARNVSFEPSMVEIGCSVWVERVTRKDTGRSHRRVTNRHIAGCHTINLLKQTWYNADPGDTVHVRQV
jgi:hypothetical protein